MKAVPTIDKRPRESFLVPRIRLEMEEEFRRTQAALMSGGLLITKKGMADTDSSFSIALSSQTLGMSCSNNQFTDCSNVKLGEERGN